MAQVAQWTKSEGKAELFGYECMSVVTGQGFFSFLFLDVGNIPNHGICTKYSFSLSVSCRLDSQYHIGNV